MSLLNNEKKFDISCVGIFVADIIAKTVDKLPAKGELLTLDSISLNTGGCALNTAIDLARIGKKVAVLGKLGDDRFGKYIKSNLKIENVNFDGIKIEEGLNTSTSLVLSDEDGERSFLHYVGSNGELIEEDIDFQIIRQSKLLFIAGVNLMSKFDGEPCGRLLEKASNADVFTALDVAWNTKGNWIETIEPCLKHLDLFMPSYNEAKMISGKEELCDITDYFYSKGVKTVVIKNGEDGCFVREENGDKYTLPTYLHVDVVDTTGAGDSFAAGFLAGLLEGWSIRECGEFANAVATFCVNKIGASTGIKSMKETLEFMNKYKTKI